MTWNIRHLLAVPLSILAVAACAPGAFAGALPATNASPATTASNNLHAPAPVKTNPPAVPAWLASPYSVPQSDAGVPGAGPIPRTEWFEQLAVLRRSQWAGQMQADQHALVFLGDGLIQKWGDQMGGDFPYVKVANRGLIGDTSREALYRLKQDVLILNPAGVVLQIGGDDIEQGVEPEIVAGNVKLILSQIKTSYPDIPVIVCQALPSSTAKHRPTGRIQKLNQLLAGVVDAVPSATLVETWRVFANARSDADTKYLPDQLYPNRAGYARWAAALRPLLAIYGLTETNPAPFEPEPGFTNLCNGRDLAGWGFVTNNFDGRTNSPGGQFLARDGRLIANVRPNKEGALICARPLADDFTLRLEFRAMPFADGSILLGGRRLACGDYALSGPYSRLAHYRPQEWNRIEIIVKNNVARCLCNDETLEAALPLQPGGSLGLEITRGQIEFRHLRLQSLAGPAKP